MLSSLGGARFVLALAQAVVCVAVAVGALVGGATLIYAFGAGYLYAAFGIGLPTPWNVVASIVLGAALILAVYAFIASFMPKRRPQSWSA